MARELVQGFLSLITDVADRALADSPSHSISGLESRLCEANQKLIKTRSRRKLHLRQRKPCCCVHMPGLGIGLLELRTFRIFRVTMPAVVLDPSEVGKG